MHRYAWFNVTDRYLAAPAELLGRRSERATLRALIAGVEVGVGASLVITGEPGIGKTALLDHLRETAANCQLARVAGVEAEVELAFGALHQLCAPFFGHLDRLAAPQRQALETAFGISEGRPPDRFLVGLAVLSLLAYAAEDEPLVCIVDDAQWLDQISAQTFAFVARRLMVERLGLVFAMRDTIDAHPLQGLPQMQLTGLDERDARTLLATVTRGKFDERVRDRIVAEARGNPLAILELPHELTAAEQAGEVGPLTGSLANHIELEFRRRIDALSPQARRLLLLAAAEPLGDTVLLRRAADDLGIAVEAASAEVQAAGLVRVRTMVRFRHPLVRSAAYRLAAPAERQAVHRALAAATDPHHDPDRRAWHLASAIGASDEDVAAGLEEASTRAKARGGAAAAAAFLDRAAQLTPDPARRGARALAAAQAKSQAGAFDEALHLLDDAQAAPLKEYALAQASLVRGKIMFASRSASASLPLLLSAAKQFEALDPVVARETYRDAMYAAFTAGQLPSGEGMEAVAVAALRMTPPNEPSRNDILLEGVSRLYTDGYAAGAPLIQRALSAYGDDEVLLADLGWLPLACRMAHNVWEFDSWSRLSATLVDMARDVGTLSLVPSALLLRLSNRVYAGDLEAATALATEATTIADVTGSRFIAHYGALVLSPWRGSEVATRQAIDAIRHDPSLRAEGKTLTATEWAAAVLYNGLGRHEEALVAARRGAAYPQEHGLAIWSMVELVEAAVRSGQLGEAETYVEAIADLTRAAGTHWAAGTEASMRAQVSVGTVAEELFREGIDRLEHTDVGMLTARTRLLYGEWLSRAGRRTEARLSLGLAYEMLTQYGATVFADRAERGLAGTGMAIQTRPEKTDAAALTAQELQIARLAANGLTNPEIGGQLFISAHTVEWHLRKVFVKLRIRSRRDISAALKGDDRTG
ncbi:LuxR family transcriptional regulator [Alloalcanivorax gelatiniphagus]